MSDSLDEEIFGIELLDLSIVIRDEFKLISSSSDFLCFKIFFLHQLMQIIPIVFKIIIRLKFKTDCLIQKIIYL